MFVGFDGNIPKYAMARSSSIHSTFLYEVEGSDKRFSFSISIGQTDTLYLFESAIDLISKLTCAKEQGLYLSLSGVSKFKKLPIALEHCLKSNLINIIYCCFDNDEIGKIAAKNIMECLPKNYIIHNSPAPQGKDYNEYLMSMKSVNAIKTRKGSDLKR